MSRLINPIQTLPFIQKVRWALDPIGYLEKAGQQYPDIFTANVFSRNSVFVVDPQGIQQVLTSDRKQLSAPGGANRILEPVVGSYSVFGLDGDPHRKRRQIVMPAFHGARLQTYGQLIFDLTKKVFDNLKPQQTFLARNITQEISLEVILQAVFGLYEGDRRQKLKQLLTTMLDNTTTPLGAIYLFFPALQKDLGAWSPWGKFLRKRQQVDKILYAEIADRRANHDPNRSDILSMLLSSVDEDGQGMTDQELRDELLGLLVAGHETTATAMAWALYWIQRSPKVKEKLLAELKTVNNPTDWTAIFKLPYLTAVCNETLRIHPVAMLTFPRLTEEPIALLGHKLDTHTVVQACIYLLHHREDLYPNADQFQPERFLDRQFSPYEFMPFGGGARRCVGEALAQFEMKIVLATILSHYHLELREDKPVKPQRKGVTLSPKGGIKIAVV